MGYSVSSIFTVSPDDKHSYFVYYVPGRQPYYNFSIQWVNEWMHKNFHNIASSIGPIGLIITPPQTRDSFQFRESYFNGLYGVLDEVLEHDYFLHEPFPFLIITKSPLKKEEKMSEGYLVNMVNFKNEQELNTFFDKLIQQIRTNNWEKIVEIFPEQELAKEPDTYGRWYKGWNEIIQLKPNFFGIGININKAIEKINGLKK